MLPSAGSDDQENPQSRTNDASVVRRIGWGAVALLLVSCTHNNYTPNVIQLSPSGTKTSPADEPIKSSFTLTAVEDGYTGQFTADTTVGTCWVVQSPTTSGGAWVVVPQGTTCAQHDVEQIKVTDQKGNSAVTYIRGTGSAYGGNGTQLFGPREIHHGRAPVRLR